jgi:hypothetical protein
MDESFDTKKLLVLRKLTRAVSDLLRGQMREYLTTLAPLLRPKTVLGDYIQSSTKESGKNPDQVFKELQSLYEKIASATPYRLPPELKPPVEIISSQLEMTPKEYRYTAQSDGESKNVIITSPLKWVLNYSGFNQSKLKERLSHRDRSAEEVRQHLLHHLVMHIVVSNQAGVTQILDALQFPIGTEYAPELGELPLTYVSSTISTIRPPDNVIIENTEISGMNAFEEVIDLGDIAQMQNPLKDRLIELVKKYDENLLDLVQK